MTSFEDILKKVGGSDKDTRHTYGHVYDDWFSKYREESINVLEVGVCQFGGGCVQSLAEYFPNATIWAIDIDSSACRSEVFANPRIKFICLNAYNEHELHRKIGDTKFSIIIDDACHEVLKQVKLLKSLASNLAEGGFYCVEDCVPSQWEPFWEELDALGLQPTVVDMSTEQQPDNTLIRFDAVS